jgi:hypothetical protein
LDASRVRALLRRDACPWILLFHQSRHGASMPFL